MADDVKNLPPEERIKVLKKLEEERKKEIEEAARIIRESEDELTERKKWTDKVPIPEFAKEDLAGLSEEAKDIVKSKGVREKKKVEEKVKKVEEKSLEETVSEEAVDVPKHIDVEYALPGERPNLGYMPASELRDLVSGVRDAVEEKGYMTREEQNVLESAYEAANNKFEAYDAGKYSMVEETAREASLIKQITGRLLDQSYHANDGAERTKDMYEP